MRRIFYKGGYKYQLQFTYRHKLPEEFRGVSIRCRYFVIENCELTIFGGYAWDGASGPTIDTQDSMRGSLVHDALCQAMRMGILSRKYLRAVHDELYRIVQEDGMCRPRAWLWLKAVVKFGEKHTLTSSRRKVLTAGAD